MKERPLSYPLVLAWTVALTVLLTATIQLLVRIRPAAAVDLVSIGAAEAFTFLILTFAVMRVHAPERSAMDALGLRPTHPGLVALGLALGLVLQVPAESTHQLVQRRFPLSELELANQAALLSTDTTLRTVVVVVVVACVAPLVEELFFRGALFGALCKSQPLAGAAAATAVAFMLGHLDLRSWPGLLIVGGVLSHLRAASGSLLPCLALHVGFNAVSIAALLTGVASVGTPLHIGVGLAAAGWLLSGGLAWAVQVVAERSEEAASARAEDAS
jgi:hypothetical protein